MGRITLKGPVSSPADDGLTFDTITGDYTLTGYDQGLVLQVDSANAVTITLPATLQEGFCCSFEQSSTGEIIFAAADGATFNAIDATYDRTSGQWAQARVYVRANSNTVSAEYVLSGDLAAPPA